MTVPDWYKQKISKSEPQTLSSGTFWVHFQTFFLTTFWSYIKLSFQWGVIQLYLKKLMSIFQVGLQDTGGLWHLKGATKKCLCKSYFYPQWPLLGNAQRNFIFTSPLSLCIPSNVQTIPQWIISFCILIEKGVSYYLDPFPSLKMPFALEADYAINEAIWVTEISSSGKDTKLFCWIIRTELGKYIMQFLWQDSIECVGVEVPHWTDIWLPENSLIVQVSPSLWWWLSVASVAEN